MNTKTLAVLITTAVILASCKNVDNAPPDQITVQLKWIHQAQFAGFYTAEAQGYYADENIEVTFKSGGVDIDVFEDVAAGDVEFSIVGADSLIVKIAEGAPITALAAIYRVNPFVLVAFADSGIASPRDFVGKTISLASSGYDEAQYLSMLKQVGVDPSEVNTVPYSYDDTAFLSGDIDVTVSFAAGSLIPLKEKVGDREINLIWPGDYGVHFYSDVIVANDELIANNPDLVLRFLRATLKGQRFAIENQDAGVDASMQYAEVQDKEVQASMLEASVPLIHTGEDHVGWMQPDVWHDMEETLRTQGLLTAPLNISEVYTLYFLEMIYGGNQ
jgi:NitT/TauT family transport system substrate-binding protein